MTFKPSSHRLVAKCIFGLSPRLFEESIKLRFKRRLNSSLLKICFPLHHVENITLKTG